MPDEQGKTLPPLPDEAFDGHKEEAPIHKTEPLKQTCSHKQIRIISDSEVRCGCGAGFTGPNILKLYKILTS